MATREVESKGLKADARAGVRLQRRDRGRVDRAATRSPPRRAPANVNGGWVGMGAKCPGAPVGGHFFPLEATQEVLTEEVAPIGHLSSHNVP